MSLMVELRGPEKLVWMELNEFVELEELPNGTMSSCEQTEYIICLRLCILDRTPLLAYNAQTSRLAFEGGSQYLFSLVFDISRGKKTLFFSPKVP